MRAGSWNVEELEPIAAEAMGRARRELDAKAGLKGADYQRYRLKRQDAPRVPSRLWGQLVVGLAECARAVMAPAAQHTISRYRRHVPPYEAQRQR